MQMLRILQHVVHIVTTGLLKVNIITNAIRTHLVFDML